ncbi:hypothetical protein [Uliginosibacterium sp. TH139]|uniref:hypothetical protein n=1 Tax=Uliginosibacterium sp. TH139 TaxID=2067453 RepID=UPI000C7CC856|nr:hypothetical protein [Uliginosibacterium sp. TH139]PLK50438.1 hypothetical protein C0V76_00995 [Uliginosibacterium sp. TH139]
MMIGLSDIKTGIDILEKLAGWVRSLRAKRKQAPESVAGRFFRLFEAHGVHRNQIPRFFGHGLTLKDVQSEAELLPKLDETALQAACNLFAVRREWLDGAEEKAYDGHDFYKHPEQVEGFLQSLIEANPDGDLDGVLLASEEREGQALIILRETIGAIGEKPIYRYHLLNNWTFSYWKARAYLAACVAVAWRKRVCIRGVFADHKTVEELASEKCLVGVVCEGFEAYLGRKWYPEDMALKPEVFLKGIDPELNNFGISSAIGLFP